MKAQLKFSYWPIEVLALAAIGFMLEAVIINDSAALAKYPRMQADTLELTRNLTIAFVIYVLMKVFRTGKFKFPKVEFEFAKQNTFKATAIGFVITVVIQTIMFAVSALPVFQTAVTSVYAFFVLAAIAEEFMFRLVIAEGAYILVAQAISNERLRIISASALSGVLFGLIHTSYYAQPFVMVSVITSGFVFSYIMLHYDRELPVFLIHILNNVIAAGSVVQTS